MLCLEQSSHPVSTRNRICYWSAKQELGVWCSWDDSELLPCAAPHANMHLPERKEIWIILSKILMDTNSKILQGKMKCQIFSTHHERNKQNEMRDFRKTWQKLACAYTNMHTHAYEPIVTVQYTHDIMSTHTPLHRHTTHPWNHVYANINPYMCTQLHTVTQTHARTHIFFLFSWIFCHCLESMFKICSRFQYYSKKGGAFI